MLVRVSFLALLVSCMGAVHADDAWLQDGATVVGDGVIAATYRVHEYTNRTLRVYKVLDDETGEIREVVLGEDDAKVDGERLFRAESDMEKFVTGKLSEPLLDIVHDSNAPDDVMVLIRVHTEDVEDSLLDGIERRKRIRDRNWDAVIPVVGELLATGLPSAQVGTMPVITTVIDKSLLYMVADSPAIASISLLRQAKPTLPKVAETTGVQKVWNKGIEGSGVKVAVLEVGGKARQDNPYLDHTQEGTTACNSNHAAAVAGVIASSNNPRRGLAPAVDLWIGGSCDGFVDELLDRADDALDWGADIVNMSFGSDAGPDDGELDFLDFAVDMGVFDWRITVVTSAGNENCYGDQFVTHPGLSYNSITVGGINDQNTASLADDVMYACSSFLNPWSVNGDRIKPEVVASAKKIRTLKNKSSWLSGNIDGTSLSAPVVSAEAALLMDRDSGLIDSPEAVKAIIMASATKNIEGDKRLSTHDGAGSVRFDYAEKSARGTNRAGWRSISYDCDRPSSLTIKTTNLKKNKRTRIVIAWSTNTNYDDYFDRPSADLDLVVRDPDNNVVATSASSDNTYEIVDFKPAKTGEYRIQVIKTRCNKKPRHVAVAWIQV